MTSNTALTDARVAHVLADVPAFSTWHNRPLTRQLRQLLSDLDEQTLMSLTAYSLHRLIEQTDPTAPHQHLWASNDHASSRSS